MLIYEADLTEVLSTADEAWLVNADSSGFSDAPTTWDPELGV
jgi:hypothetical protein